MNNEITRITNEHKRQKWRQFVETLEHKTDHTKLWITIKAVDGKLTPKAENEAITFDGSQVSFPNQIANYFNRQFSTSKLCQHTSSRLVSREIKRKSLTSEVTFTTYQVTKEISSCSNTRALGPDKFIIFHLNHLGPRENKYRYFLSAYLAPLSSSDIYGGSLTSHHRQPPAPIRRPTRFPTRALYHFCFATTDE